MCVLLRREKSSLCKGPCPTSVPFVQKGICCHCLGKFHALSACAESSVKGEQERKSLFPFVIFKYKGKQPGGLFFSKVFCWHCGNQESKPQLGWDPHPLACWIFKWRGADLNEELEISSEVQEVYWLLEIVLLPGLCRMCKMWHRGCVKDRTLICEGQKSLSGWETRGMLCNRRCVVAVEGHLKEELRILLCTSAQAVQTLSMLQWYHPAFLGEFCKS